MTFLRARRDASTAAFWSALQANHHGAPDALQELARGDKSVVCHAAEAEAALAWAGQHPAWTNDPPPVYITGA